MIVAEIPHAIALQIHHPHDLILQDERYGNLRAYIGVRRDVSRILGRIVHPHHLARFRRRAGEPLAQRYVINIHPLVVANAEEVLQRLRLVVHRENAERVVVHQVAHGARDLGEQLVQIQDGRKFARDVGQCLQRAVLPLHAPVEPRIVDRRADARRNQPHQRAVVFGIRVDPRGLQVDHAHQFAARRHGDGELGAHRIHRVEIARIVAHIAHQHGLAAGRRRPGNALAHRDGEVADHLVAMSHGVADAQIATALAV